MADLPNNSFVKVNDVETAQGAPVSEALAQKYGTNENTNNNEILLNDTDIATNVTNIATNATNIATNVSDIAAILQPEIFNFAVNPGPGFTAVHTFAASPTTVVVGVASAASATLGTAVVLNQTNNFSSATTVAGGSVAFRLTGVLLEVTEVSGTVGSTIFAGHGFV